jgi:hypothetical protein
MTSVCRWTIGVCVAICLPAAALAAGPITFGLKGGLVVANVSPREIAGGLAQLDSKRGPGGGAFVDWELNSRVTMSGEVLYVSKGTSLGKFDVTDANGTTIGTVEFLHVVDYMEIPLLVRATLPVGGSLHPALVLGPTVAFKVREQAKTTGAASLAVDTDEFSSTDVGLAAGAQLWIRSGPGQSLLEVRYTFGLKNVTDSFAQDTKNRALTVMAGYAF